MTDTAPRLDSLLPVSPARAPAVSVMLFSASAEPMASEAPAAVKPTLATTTVALMVPLMSASIFKALPALPSMREPLTSAVADEPIRLRALAPPPASETPPRPAPTLTDTATDTVVMAAWLSALTVIAGAPAIRTPSMVASVVLPISFCASEAATDKAAVAPSDTATAIATAAMVLLISAWSSALTVTLPASKRFCWFWSLMRAVMPVWILLTARAPAPAPETARLAPSTTGGA